MPSIAFGTYMCNTHLQTKYLLESYNYKHGSINVGGWYTAQITINMTDIR